jgi:threonine/homoserine/homoserine lactone efflux protein
MPPCPDDLVPPDISAPAAQWMWIGIIVAVVVFEIVMLHTGQPTLSQFVQHKPRWFRVLSVVGLAVLGWHLLFGGPL